MQKRGVSFFLAAAAMTLVSFAGIERTCAQHAPATLAAVPESAPIPPEQIPQHIRAAVNAADRPAADRSLDAGRKPEHLLAFFRIAPGMTVADLSAGGGYTTELLARAVGPTGTVYPQNPPSPPEFQHIGQAWAERFKNPVLKNVIAVTKMRPTMPDITSTA